MNGPHEGRPVPIGRWASEQAPQDAANRMVTTAPGREIVPLQPGEGTVVYGKVQSYPSDPHAPTSLEVPAGKALALRQNDGVVHIFPIDDSHYLYNKPSGTSI